MDLSRCRADSGLPAKVDKVSVAHARGWPDGHVLSMHKDTAFSGPWFTVYSFIKKCDMASEVQRRQTKGWESTEKGN